MLMMGLQMRWYWLGNLFYFYFIFILFLFLISYFLFLFYSYFFLFLFLFFIFIFYFYFYFYFLFFVFVLIPFFSFSPFSYPFFSSFSNLIQLTKKNSELSVQFCNVHYRLSCCCYNFFGF